MITVHIKVEGGNIDRDQVLKLLSEAVKTVSELELTDGNDYDGITVGNGHLIHTSVKVDDKEWTNATQLNCCG